MQCLCVFAGESGHKGPVLSVDFHPSGEFIASSGMDYYCKVWRIPKEYRTLNSLVMQNPIHSSNCILKEYIDCVKWLGKELIICKGINGKIRIIHFSTENSLPLEVLCDLCYPMETSLWYFRFSIDPVSKKLAVGSEKGKIYIFNLKQAAECSIIYPETKFKISPPRLNCDSRANVRDLYIFDSKVTCIHEDGHVYFVDLKEKEIH